MVGAYDEFIRKGETKSRFLFDSKLVLSFKRWIQFSSFANILWFELKADRPGREKLCVGGAEPVRVVLESDGTQVFVYIMIGMRMIDNDNLFFSLNFIDISKLEDLEYLILMLMILIFELKIFLLMFLILNIDIHHIGIFISC